MADKIRDQESTYAEAAEGEERPYLFFNKALNPLITHARCVSYTTAPTVDSATPLFSTIAPFFAGIASPLLPLSQDLRLITCPGKGWRKI